MAQQAILWSYSNKTLQGNWHEDRIQVPADVEFGSQKFLTIKQNPDTTRCIPIHYEENEEQEYTTQTGTVHAGEKAEPIMKAHKMMVSGDNFHEIHTVRTTAAPEKGFGSTLPHHPSTEFEVHRQTTYKAKLEEEPAAWKLMPPPPEQGDDMRFRGGYPANCNPSKPDVPVYGTTTAFRKKGLDLDLDKEKRPENMRGSYGTRGPNVRTPNESGSRSAVSVFADEYSLGK